MSEKIVGIARTIKVGIKTSFVALHWWSDAPEEVSFLRDPHRHTFNVMMELSVDRGSRQIEFFIAKRILDEFISENWGKKDHTLRMFPSSCEMIADQIAMWAMQEFKVNFVKVVVQEDDENYGVVELEGHLERRVDFGG